MTEHKPLYALADPEQTVKIAVCYNPMDLTDREQAELVWGHERTLADYMDGLPDTVEWAVGINGKVIDAEQWREVTLAPGDYITATPVPRGGGGGKGIIRLVAMIAVAAFAAWAGPAIAAGMTGLTAGSAAAAASTSFAVISGVAGAVVTAAGAMLVNALLPPPMPDTPDANLNEAQRSSPTYGVDGPKNSSQEGVRVPVVYGLHRYGGNMAGIHVENDGTKQHLFLMNVISEGEIEDITDIKINDQPIDNYQDVETRFLPGTADQYGTPWFNETIIPEHKGMRLKHDEDVLHTTVRKVDKLRLDFVAPRGFSYFDDQGSLHGRSVPLIINYRRLGEDQWTSVGDVVWKTGRNSSVASGYPVSSGPARFQSASTVYIHEAMTRARIEAESSATGSERSLDMELYTSTDGASWSIVERRTVYNPYYGTTTVRPVTASFQTPGYSPGQRYFKIEIAGSSTRYAKIETISAQVQEPYIFKGRSTSAVRDSLVIESLAEDRYEISVRRGREESTSTRVQEQVDLVDVNEIISDPVGYRRTALLCTKILVTDQLNQRPTITGLVKGRKLRQFDYNGNETAYEWSNNPAWITLDILTARYGAQVPLERIDIPSFVEWAEFCDEKGLTFNGVFDWGANVWDAIQRVLRVGHAQVNRVGTRYSVVTEAPSAPVMMFGVSNMIEDTFSIEWLPIEDRANEIEMSFYDEEDDYRQATIRVASPDAIDDGRPRRTAPVNMIGVTNRTQAVYEAWLHLQMNRLIHQTVTFSAPLEAIACVPGDLVLVQHDMPKWGFGGRIESVVSNNEVILDKDVEIDMSKPHKLLVHQSALRRQNATISNVVGDVIVVSGVDPEIKAKRVISGSRDIGITGIYEGAGGTEIALESTDGLYAGLTVELWDTDVIFERDVITWRSSGRRIQLYSGWEGTIEPGANFMFGPVEKTSKPFRVLAVNGDGENEREIKAIEYNESVYEDPENAVVESYTSLPDSVPAVKNLYVADTIRRVNGQIRTFVTVSWENPTEGLYGGAEVYVATNGGEYQMKQRLGASSSFFEFEANDKSAIDVRVASLGSGGGRMPLWRSPRRWHYVLGKYRPPMAPTNFQGRRVIGGIELTWEAPDDIDVTGYNIWANGKKIAHNHDSTHFKWEGIEEPGEYRFEIRSLDVVNLQSWTVAITVDAPPPAVVNEFEATQVANSVVMAWDENPAGDLVQKYEVRRGYNWSAGDKVGVTDSNRITVPLVVGAEETYWIKAINDLGFYSTRAAYSTIALVEHEDHNLIWNQDERAINWSGSKNGFFQSFDNHLIMKDGRAHAEYTYLIDLPAEHPEVYEKARVYMSDTPEAVLLSTAFDWTEANFGWTEPEAITPWIDDGDIETVTMRRRMSLYRGPVAEEVEGFTLHNDTTGIRGTTPSASKGVSFDEGRFLNGVLVNDMTTLTWPISTAGEFSVVEWIRPRSEIDLGVIMSLGGDSVTPAIKLEVIYNRADATLTLRGSDGVDVVANNVSLNADELIILAVAQTATERVLRIGKPVTGEQSVGRADAAPLGGMTWLSIA